MQLKEKHKSIYLLEKELHSVGIRLNKRPPNISLKVKSGGGLAFNSTIPLTHVDEKLVRGRIILHVGIQNSQRTGFVLREDATVDDLFH